MKIYKDKILLDGTAYHHPSPSCEENKELFIDCLSTAGKHKSLSITQRGISIQKYETSINEYPIAFSRPHISVLTVHPYRAYVHGYENL